MGRRRLALGTLGVLVLLYGVRNLLVHVPTRDLGWLAGWLVAAVVIQHGLVSPAVIAVGALLRRLVPDRGRRYLQVALLIAAPVTVIALPLIYRQGSQPPSKALLLQNYPGNLGLLLGLVGALCLIGYAVRVARDHSSGSSPPA
jgi:hypothetical protein